MSVHAFDVPKVYEITAVALSEPRGNEFAFKLAQRSRCLEIPLDGVVDELVPRHFYVLDFGGSEDLDGIADGNFDFDVALAFYAFERAVEL